MEIPPQSPNTLTLKKLDAASQAGRVSLPGQTRGQKADRLQLVAKIDPITGSDAAQFNWSATGIAIVDGNAYVSWHSNHQATTPAERWGGALDVINIAALETPGADVITNTLTSTNAKFNNVVADATNIYLPMTCYNNGAVVGRVAQSALAGTDIAIDTIAIPGSSVNSLAINNGTIYAVSGYAGGVYSMPTDFVMRETDAIPVVPYAADFGGKYIVGNRVLRTNDEHAYIVDITNNTERDLGAPLLSQEKYAEAYDPANDRWYSLTGDQARHYGKHTMAIANNYTYVAGGIGENGANGLRVYTATSGDRPVWQNGTNTTAVTVDDNYVYAATGAGLRVYEKYNGTDLPLFAYEVQEYENGMAVGHQAGTSAQSSNFVAVGGGYIFVACGQSGVYVFKLDTTVPPEKVNVSLTIPAVDWSETKKVDEGAGGEFTIPTDKLPADTEDGYFAGYTDEENGTEPNPDYAPGKTITVSGDKTLYPVYKPYALIIKYEGNAPEGETATVAGLPATYKSKEASAKVSETTPTLGDMVFLGWSKTANVNAALVDNGTIKAIKGGDELTTADAENGVVTLYAVWIDNASAGGSQGTDPDPEPEPDPDENGGDTGGGGDPNNSNW